MSVFLYRKNTIVAWFNNPMNSWFITYEMNPKISYRVFVLKYRRKVFYEERRTEVIEIIRMLCQWKDVETIEGEICPDFNKYTAKDEHIGFYGISKREE